jgi:diguanylate cyclase (GGDEF)-like protein
MGEIRPGSGSGVRHLISKEFNKDEAFDRITKLLQDVFDVDVAAVALIEGGRQKFRSILGMDLTEIPLDHGFCRATWREGRSVVICDVAADLEFHDHPLVTSPFGLRAYAGTVVRTSKGEAIGTICVADRKPRAFLERDVRVLEDIANIAASEFELREFAYRDVLTGALSRRRFLRELEGLCDLASRTDIQLSVIMLDVDHFKSVNDRFGHFSGDEVLRSLVAACQANLRDADLIGRLGGEEFAIALQGPPETASLMAERLRHAVSGLRFDFDGDVQSVTASFGVATFEPSDADLEAVLLRADNALYRAKTTGRDRVVVGDAPGHEERTPSPVSRPRRRRADAAA